MTKLAKVFRKANDVGFKAEMTYVSQPCFVKHNYSAVGVNDDGGFVIDYERLCVSRGTLPLLGDVVVNAVGDKVSFGWQWDKKQGGRYGDKVVAALYFPDYKYLGCVDDGVGEDCGLEVEVPGRYWGLRVYCYLFVYDNDGRSSDSQFVSGNEVAVVEGVAKREMDDIVLSNGNIFVGVEQREEEVEGKIKRKFVIYFRDEDELLEEVLEEPVDAADFERMVVGGVHIMSNSEMIMRRFRELIRDVNPGLFVEKYSRGQVLEADTWGELCGLVTRAVKRE